MPGIQVDLDEIRRHCHVHFYSSRPLECRQFSTVGSFCFLVRVHLTLDTCSQPQWASPLVPPPLNVGIANAKRLSHMWIADREVARNEAISKRLQYIRNLAG